VSLSDRSHLILIVLLLLHQTAIILQYIMASQDYQPHENGISPVRTHDTAFDSEEKLRFELAKTVTLTPELYERLFISPKTEVKGDLRNTFGNPTPVGVLGFSVSVLPLACAFSMSSPSELYQFSTSRACS
jgi:hypothetical protein